VLILFFEITKYINQGQGLFWGRFPKYFAQLPVLGISERGVRICQRLLLLLLLLIIPSSTKDKT
jgi:hypothetical protein